MAINIGSLALQACKKGTTNVKAIYKGDTLIWPIFKYGTWTNMGSFSSNSRENFGFGSSDENTVYCGASGYSASSVTQAMNALSCVTDETGGGIYIVGGQTSAGAQNYFRYWNEVTQTYVTLPSMPDKRKQHRVIYDPDKQYIYVIGGENANSTATDTVFEYHIKEAKWYTNCPTTLSIHGLHRDGNIYTLFGRNASKGSVTNIYKYVP